MTERAAFERICVPNFNPGSPAIEDHWQTWQEAWQAATLAERERCAKVCDKLVNENRTIGRRLAVEDCAAAIRKGPTL
jgi:hypothetical protein